MGHLKNSKQSNYVFDEITVSQQWLSILGEAHYHVLPLPFPRPFLFVFRKVIAASPSPLPSIQPPILLCPATNTKAYRAIKFIPIMKASR